MNQFEKEANEILLSKSESKWLKTAIIGLIERDILDTMSDLQTLQELFRIRYNEVINETEYYIQKASA